MGAGLILQKLDFGEACMPVSFIILFPLCSDSAQIAKCMFQHFAAIYWIRRTKNVVFIFWKMQTHKSADARVASLCITLSFLIKIGLKSSRLGNGYWCG